VHPHWAGRHDAEADDSPLVLSTLLSASACKPGSWISLQRTLRVIAAGMDLQPLA